MIEHQQPNFLPSPEEIAAECAAIQSTWDRETWRLRLDPSMPLNETLRSVEYDQDRSDFPDDLENEP